MILKTNEYTYSFKNFRTTKTFGKKIYDGKITIEEADKYETDLLVKIMSFRKNMKLRSHKKDKKKNCFWKLV